MTDSNDRPQDEPKSGKRYSAPVLTEYGSDSKLTMGKGGSFVETPTQKKTAVCL